MQFGVSGHFYPKYQVSFEPTALLQQLVDVLVWEVQGKREVHASTKYHITV